MTDNRQAIATQPTCSGPRSDKIDRIAELLRTLAPIRAIGMSDQMAHDWAAVILAETTDLSDHEFASGCERARQECTDHRQVLRQILKGDPAGRVFRDQMRQWDAALQDYLAGYPQIGHSGGVKKLGQLLPKAVRK